MGDLQVCSEGLHALAGQCAADSARIDASVSSGVSAPPAQATATAVAGAYTTMRSTATVLAARVQATGDKLSAAATHYVNTDEASAFSIDSSRA